MTKRPVLYILIPFCAGIISSYFLKLPILHPFLLSVILLFASFLYSKNKNISHVALYLAVFFFAFVHYANYNTLPANHITNLLSDEPKKITVRGVIIDEPVTEAFFYGKDRTSFVLDMKSYKNDTGWNTASALAKVDVYSPAGRQLSFGDEVILEGFIAPITGLKNPGLFDYSEYLGIKGIYASLKVRANFPVEVLKKDKTNLVKKTALSLRGRMRKILDEYFDAPYGGFLKAILIGDRSSLKTDIKEDFIKTGTVHILAISGLHVGIIAGIILMFFGILRIPRRANLLLTLCALIFYSFLAGANPPIVRSVIMFAVFAIGYIINRDADTLNSLSIAAFLILLNNPKELFDPSFQLSFVSVASIIVFVPKINELAGLDFSGKKSAFEKLKLYVMSGISVSIAAWLGSWPIVAAYFNIISPVSIIANLVVIPALFLLTAASFLFFFLSLVSNLFASILAQGLSATEAILFSINNFLANLPLAHFRIGAPSVYFSILYYALIALIFAPAVIEFQRIRVRKSTILLVILLAFNIFAWRDNMHFKKGELKITFLDVGQGDSAFIEFPDGRNLLIDAASGGDDERFDIGKSIIAPYLWNKGIKHIDAAVVTHFHEDHLGGMIYVLENFKVGCVIDNGGVESSGSKIYSRYIKTIKERKIRHLSAGGGDTIGPFGDAKLFVLNPPRQENIMLLEENDNSIVMKLIYKNFSVIFCGDIRDAAMAHLMSYGGFLKSDCLKVPHHAGSLGNEKAVKEFFEKVSPRICVISVGKINRYKAPSKKTLDILSYLRSESYETRNDGAVTITVNPDSRISLQTARK